MSERVPCPVEHLNFSRSIRIGDETHVQTCLRLGVDDKEVPNGQPVWTTVGIVYDRPVQPKSAPGTQWPEVVVCLGFLALVGYLGRKLW